MKKLALVLVILNLVFLCIPSSRVEASWSVSTLAASWYGDGNSVFWAELGASVAVSGDSISDWGFVWDSTPHIDPGSAAPGDSGYLAKWEDSGSETSPFSFSFGPEQDSGPFLFPYEVIYYRACAKSGGVWDYGAELVVTGQSSLWLEGSWAPYGTSDAYYMLVTTNETETLDYEGGVVILRGQVDWTVIYTSFPGYEYGIDDYGFVVDTTSHDNPSGWDSGYSDVHPDASDYADYYEADDMSSQEGDFLFSYELGDLEIGETYYVRAVADLTIGGDWVYGPEIEFELDPGDFNPDTMAVVDRTCSSLTVQLTKSEYSPMSEVRYSPTAQPTTRTAGYKAFPVGTYTGTESLFTFYPGYPEGSIGGQLYYLSAWGYDEDLGWSENYTTTSDYTLPCDPSNLIASVVSDTRIDLSWTRGQGGDTTAVYGRVGTPPTSRGDPEAFLAYSGNSLSCAVTGLTADTVYYFRAWAYDTDSTYYSSGFAQVGAGSSGSPSVTTLEATDVTPVGATLNGFVDYDGGMGPCWVRFQYGTDNVDENSTSWVGGKVTGNRFSWSITGLTILTTYKFRIQAYNVLTGIGSPVSGSTLTFTTCEEIGDPEYLYADPASSTEIDLSWVSGSCSDRSIVQYSETAYPATRTGGLNAYYGNSTVFSLTGLKPGTTYYFRVWSGEATGTYFSTGYSEAVATTPSGGGDSVPYKFTDTSNWFTDPDCSRVQNFPGYYLIEWSATGIGWDDCIMAVFWIFILTIVVGLVVALASKGNLSAVLVAMGLILLLAVVAGPLPKAWFIIYLVFAAPAGYLLPKGAGV